MTSALLRSGGRLWRAGFWICLTGAAVLALLPKPPRLPLDRFGDKFEHMLAFAVLAGLAQLAFPRISRLWLWLWLSLFGAGIELAQAIPPLHRDSSLADWVVDSVVAALVLALPLLLLRPRSAATVKG